MQLIHAHSTYSIGDGMQSSDNLVSTAKKKGMKAVALSDHGTMAAAYSFWKACEKHEIKPIIGCEVYYNPNLEASKNAQDRWTGHLAIFAKNRKGYIELVKLSSKGWTEGFYYRPRVDEFMLKSHAGDLVVTTACMGGVLKDAIKKGPEEGIRQVRWLQSIFGKDNVFVEIQLLEMSDNVEYVRRLIEMKNKYPTEVKLILGQDCHYANREDWTTHEVMLNIQAGKAMSDPGRRIYPTKTAFIRSESDQKHFYKEFGYASFMPENYLQESMVNTCQLASMVETYSIKHDPVYVDVSKFGFKDSLKDKVMEGVKFRGILLKENKDVYLKRIKYEMDVVKKLGIDPYFLASQAIVDIARNNDVLVGPGRGSSAGSLINYLIGTTNIDPIKHGLLFERFINPDRVELPDIDVDYSHIDVVNDQLRKVFGERNVTRLATYSFFMYKSLIRDLARVYQYDIGETNEVAAAVSSVVNLDKFELDVARTKVPKFDQWLQKHSRDHIEIHMSKLHGLIRHKGVHAAGLILTTDEVSNWFPVERHRNIIVSAYTEGQKARDLNDLGGVKFDVLGLKTLRIQQDTLKFMAARRKFDWKKLLPLIDFSKMNYEDKKVYDTVFKKGDTLDIFQFESPVARKILRDVKAENFFDITAINALNRPGPLKGNYHEIYAEQKHSGNVEKRHPIIDEILAETYGTIVYQEQVVRLCKEMGNLSNSEAELVRKGIFKLRSTHIERDQKIQDEILKKIEVKLFENAKKNGILEKHTKKIWRDIQAFVAYSFNKAHAASYAAVAYQSAWLKTYYPIEWHCAYLNSITGEAKKVRTYITYLSKKGIKVVSPHVESAKLGKKASIVNDQTIRLGTNILKNVGTDMGAFSECHAGQYDDFIRFFILALNDPNTNVNKRVMEALIKIGFFDDYPVWNHSIKSMSRGHLMLFYKALNDKRGMFKFNPNKGRNSVQEIITEHSQFLLNTAHDVLEEKVEDFSNYQAEVEVMNFSMEDHPYLPYKEKIDKIKKAMESGKVAVMGEITATKDKTAKNGRPYRVITISDVFSGKQYRLMAWEHQIVQWNPCTGEGGVWIITEPDPKYGTSKILSFTNVSM